MSKSKILEGIFAIHKPKSISSAQVVRNIQKVFDGSKFFAPWLADEKARLVLDDGNQRRTRKNKQVHVKMGHGGTLDPLATGVLIIGVGKGTKQLPDFLDCTKSYEATMLLGAATDTYDILGKVLDKGPYAHIRQQDVEAALEPFRGKIMQRPPIYSALRMGGKRLYEYAREGKPLPKEIKERPVEVEELEITEWLDGGSHDFKWPDKEAPEGEKDKIKQFLHLQGAKDDDATKVASESSVSKRKRPDEGNEDDQISEDLRPAAKRHEDDEALMSGGLQESADANPAPTLEPEAVEPIESPDQPTDPGPPAVGLKMTVSSGFYVRALCHDLGKALGSLGIMASLVRTRQGDFQVGKNVLDYDDLDKGEEVWGPKVEAMFQTWEDQMKP